MGRDERTIAQGTKETLKDLKETQGGRMKPDITHIRLATMVYGARACEYGSCKYERSNFLRPIAGTPANFRRYRDYLRAVLSHTVKLLDSMERHQAQDPDLCDEEGMVRAADARDTDVGLSFPASQLPHAAHLVASVNMAITQAVEAGLIPADPGRPWEDERGNSG